MKCCCGNGNGEWEGRQRGGGVISRSLALNTTAGEVFLWQLEREGETEWGGWNYAVKGTQAWNFFLTFFAETETIWSQGPVTRDFWKLYSIRPRYSRFKTFPRMLSMWWNRFRVCSACDDIRSAYAQCAIKFVPHMLSKDCKCKNCSHFTAVWACAEIRSSYAQCAMKSVLRWWVELHSLALNTTAGEVFLWQLAREGETEWWGWNYAVKGTQALNFFLLFLQKPKPYGPKGL